MLTRSELTDRMPAAHLGRPQRTDFHLLVVCTDGEGTHDVDFVTHRLAPGSVVRIRPGQIHEHAWVDGFDTVVAIWRAEHHPREPGRAPWFPGSPEPMAFELSDETFARVLAWLGELRTEQDRFEGSARRLALMRSILSALLLLVDEGSNATATRSALPQPYLDLSELLEHELYRRPSVAELARQLGYSSRTLDRACRAVSGRTAKQTVDERIRLELRRMLADDRVPLTKIRHAFGFDEASNFTKFVRRVVGQTPGEFRAAMS